MVRKRVFQVLLVLYILALAASHIYRWTRSDFSPRHDQDWVQLAEVSDGTRGSRLINLSFVDSGGDGPVVILLHGSPVASKSLMDVHRFLANEETFRVITPDLPGFEGSTHDIADYSIAAHAMYLEALMDSLAVESAHLVGYSMSGGVVTMLMDRNPERIASVVLLAGIGVQELELLGDYYLNHSIHALQYAGLWILSEGIPHFGWMDTAILGIPYARNFLDTDQRPLRAILSNWSGPTLILHGEDDVLVPYEVAKEHHRIIAQSELITLAGVGHGIPFEIPDRAAEIIANWVKRVESGNVPTRQRAEPDRLRASLLPFDPSSIPPAEGFSLYMLMFLIAVVTLVNEDLASIGAGLMAAHGTFEFEHALIAAFGGILFGDIALYLSGRILGRRVAALPPFSWFIDERKMERGAAWFRHKGAKVIIASRFVPGSRLPTYVAAGVLKAPFWKFLGYFLIATVVWTPFIVGISTLLGNQILDFWSVYESYAVWVLVAVIAFIYGFLSIAIPLTNHNGRRKLLSRWRRISRWEFWPPFVFYPPVFVYVAYLAIRNRSLMAFTAANPGIDAGGFVGESKHQILNLLSNARSFVARYLFVDEPHSAVDRVLAFMENEGLSYPLILKPDVGERGNAVRIAHSDEDVRSYFATYPDPAIAQEYVEGKEFGVFFIRHPGEENGSIISITEKILVSITGNGHDTLERLILDDDRAVCMSPLFFRRHARILDDVIKDGEIFELVSVGTHSRGALFLNGERLLSHQLEKTFNEIAAGADGFFFGRFDVRVPSAEHLARGEGIKVLELNGVTSEVTHIYDPSTSLRSAYMNLFDQWHIAFDIGKENMRRGAEPAAFFHVLRLVFQFKVRPKIKPDAAAPATI